jgi:hypothetical protein
LRGFFVIGVPPSEDLAYTGYFTVLRLDVNQIDKRIVKLELKIRYWATCVTARRGAWQKNHSDSGGRFRDIVMGIPEMGHRPEYFAGSLRSRTVEKPISRLMSVTVGCLGCDARWTRGASISSRLVELIRYIEDSGVLCVLHLSREMKWFMLCYRQPMVSPKPKPSA